MDKNCLLDSINIDKYNQTMLMMVVKLVINGFAVLVTGYLLQGVHISNFFVALAVAIVLGIINTLLKPVLLLLTLPINILSLGIFTIILNGLLILLTSAIVPGFKVDGLLWAILFSIVLSLVNWFLNLLTK